MDECILMLWLPYVTGFWKTVPNHTYLVILSLPHKQYYIFERIQCSNY